MIHGSDVKWGTEILLAQDTNVDLNPLQVCFRVTCIAHQVTGILVALGESDLDTVWPGDPLRVLELSVQDGGLLSEPPAFAVPILDIIWPDDTHLL